MKFTIEDLKSPDMQWTTINSMYGEKSFKDWKKTYNGLSQKYVICRIRGFYSLISQSTGIPVDEIEQFYRETYSNLNLVYDDIDPNVNTNDALMSVLDSCFRVPMIKEYIEMMQKKCPERRKKEELINLWHDCSLDVQKMTLLLFAGLLGVGSNNTINHTAGIDLRRWRERLNTTDVQLLDELFDTITEKIKTDKDSKVNAARIITMLDVRNLSIKSLYNIVKHVEKDYFRRLQRNSEYLINQDDKDMEALIGLVKTILEYELSYNIEDIINEKRAELQELQNSGNTHLLLLKLGKSQDSSSLDDTYPDEH